MDKAQSRTGVLRGYLEKEDEQLNAFVKRFCVLEKTKNTLYCFREDPKTAKFPDPVCVIEIQYVTKIDVTTQKPKKDCCFEISTASKRHFFAAPTKSAMQVWVDELHKLAVNPQQSIRTVSESSALRPSSIDVDSQKPFCADTSFQTSIIGGVVVKAPAAKKQEAAHHGIGLIMEGWSWKQGARMKNWKRRYFTLTVVKLCYYESKEDKEAIRSIPVQVIERTSEASGFCNRDNVLQVHTPSRTFYMQLDTPDELRRWRQAIDSVILQVPDEQRRGLSL